MDEGIFEKISSVTTFKEAYEILWSTYERVDKVWKLRLQTQRENLKAWI